MSANRSNSLSRRLVAILAVLLLAFLPALAGAAGPAVAAGVEGRGRVVSDVATQGNVQGRRSAIFRDGQYIRVVEVRPGNVLILRTVEGEVLYTERAIEGSRYSIQSIATDVSSFSGTVVLVLGGFTPDSGDSRTIILSTDYRAAPPQYYLGP